MPYYECHVLYKILPYHTTLRYQKVLLDNDFLCPICIEKDYMYINIAKLKCGHMFHEKCIQCWYTYSGELFCCPVCKQYINYKIS